MTETIKTLIEPIQNRLNAANLGPLGLSISEDRKWGLLLENPGTRDERLVAKHVDDDEAELFANAPTDQSRLLAAVQAVTALHKHEFRNVELWAKGYKYSGDHCGFDGEEWPCATIAAIESALTEAR